MRLRGPIIFCEIMILSSKNRNPKNWIFQKNLNEILLFYDRKFLHSEETILKMPAFMRAPKQDDY